MRTRITRVHGHEMQELGQLVNDSWRGESGLVLGSEGQGGWNSITLLARTAGQSYLLKLPTLKGPFREHPYAHEYKVMGFLYRKGLCPKPVQLGRLKDDRHTPFIILEYVEGTVPSTLEAISAVNFRMLDRTLSILSKLHPPGIPSYSKPSDYLTNIAALTHRIREGAVQLPLELIGVLESYDRAVDALDESVDASCFWSRNTMHGDLQESNMVLQPDRVLLLDMGSCCIGEPLYDLAYLLSQAEGSTRGRLPEALVKSPSQVSDIEALRPLALLSAIGWSIGFLVNLERSMVEPNLASPEVSPRVLAYVNDKMDIVSSYLGHLDV
jgi:aminoglycoside phosphotransferase (APT) family kinase protein